jgi:2-desacetyl-2-hydroxyethyl bacteriochlorophyllide A dehydrogenase
MKAIVYHGARDLRFEGAPDPKLQAPEDAIVRVTRAAICGSDLHLYHGLPVPDVGFAVGHEFVGVVEEVGPAVREARPKDRVFAACTTGCGRCFSCRGGLTSGCEVTTAGGSQNIFGFSAALPGGQAEAVRVPFADANLHRIPAELEDEQVLFLTDILPTAYMGAELAEVGAGDVVVVFGCGPVGLFAQRCAELRGAARIVAVDLDEGRLGRARQWGYETLQPQREDLTARVLQLSGGRGADAVIEAVGRPELLERACELARSGGRIAAVGVIAEPVTLPFFPGFLTKNLTLRSGVVSPQASWPRLLPLIESGRFDPTDIVTHRLSLSEGLHGYEIFDAHREDALKVVLTP